jgi:hypothetical protein
MTVGNGNGFVGARSDLLQINWWGPDGTLRQILRWKGDRPYQKESDLDSFIAFAKPEMRRLNPSMSDEQIDQIMSRQRERMVINTNEPYPFFRYVLGDGNGGVWLSEFDLFRAFELSAVPHWSIIAPDGEWLGDITLPDRLRLLDVRGDRILGVLADSLDVQSVAIFQLQNRAAP